MTLSYLLPQIPVVALILLIIVGAIIVFEIWTMIRSKKPIKTEQIKKEKYVEVMKPLKFPHINSQITSGVFIPSGKLKYSKKTLITVTTTVFIISIIGFCIYYIIKNIDRFALKDPEIPKNQSASQNSQENQLPKYNAQFILYLETNEDLWTKITESELSTLKAGDVIKIGIKTDQSAQKVEILVNDEQIPLSPGKTPEGYHYARYIILDEKSDYKVAARIY